MNKFSFSGAGKEKIPVRKEIKSKDKGHKGRPVSINGHLSGSKKRINGKRNKAAA